MSICFFGLKDKSKAGCIKIGIDNNHPLLQLSNIIDWEKLAEIVLPDLKATTANGKWWLGRKLKLRIHLGAYLIQHLYNKTDRQLEYDIKDNAAIQIFCGKQLVDKWHCPDHTKIEEFRSRLSPETHQKLANIIETKAVKLGFADPTEVDIDSTKQEANMSYPSDVGLLCKLSSKVTKVISFINENIHPFCSIKPMEINLKKIKSLARTYFFKSKNTDLETKKSLLKSLFDCVKKETRLAISNIRCMSFHSSRIPWNIKKDANQIAYLALKYLDDVEEFINTDKMVPDKILSFHLEAVTCLTNNKIGDKKYIFGRQFQLARIKGNYAIVGKCTNVEMNDKYAIESMISLHNELFDIDAVSVATDKGYYSKKNDKILENANVKYIGIQSPKNITESKINQLPCYKKEELINRRAGIEPIIGHIKNRGQLRRSRMKTDKTIESSGYTSVLGFNLKQLIKHNTEQINGKAA